MLPPPLFEELQLTPEQLKALDALENDVRVRLEKILTADQLQIVEQFQPKKKGPPDGDFKGPKKGKGPPPDKD